MRQISCKLFAYNKNNSNISRMGLQNNFFIVAFNREVLLFSVCLEHHPE